MSFNKELSLTNLQGNDLRYLHQIFIMYKAETYVRCRKMRSACFSSQMFIIHDTRSHQNYLILF